ncbi:MAG: hypothetical protein ABI165_04425, partial [Bryobacteraceae bacterium]
PAPQGWQGITLNFGACVLVSDFVPIRWVENMREREQRANFAAIGYLRAAGYDPAGLLDLLSKLAYEHTVWARAIVPEDLLGLRTALETDSAPSGGYMINSSRFVQAEARLTELLGHSARRTPRLGSGRF